jgi:queuine/archaeosine tRNA-ribosyltransferase
VAKTGTSMGSKLINTRKVKPIKCDCRVCFHSERITLRELKKSYRYCKYYDIIKPNKTQCARFYKVR